MFLYGDSAKYELDRNRSILKRIFSTNVWAVKDLLSVKILLRDLCAVLDENSIDYFISEGTLLGHVRHQQIIPWDDDVDLSLDKNDIETLISKVSLNTKFKILKSYWGKRKVEYYKFFSTGSQHILNFNYGFPFIDIWTYDRNEYNITYNHGFKVPSEIIYPTRTTLFEDVFVNIPNKPLKYLDLKYPEWRERIVVYPWSHKMKKEVSFLCPQI